MSAAVHHGMRLDNALDAARRAGLEVRPIQRTGEMLVRRTDGRAIRLNNRRKDAPRALTTYLMQLQRTTSQET